MKAKDIKGTKAARIVKQSGRNLPKTIFAKYEWTSTEDPWMEASEYIEKLAEKDETVYVGEYRLVKVGKVDLKLQVS